MGCNWNFWWPILLHAFSQVVTNISWGVYIFFLGGTLYVFEDPHPTYLPPALAEEVIFSVASVCLSVCLHSTGWTIGPTDLKFGAGIKDHHISKEFEGQGHRSKVNVTKVNNVKIPVFSLVLEKVSKVQGQGHEGQGQSHRSRSKVVDQVTGLRSHYYEKGSTLCPDDPVRLMWDHSVGTEDKTCNASSCRDWPTSHNSLDSINDLHSVLFGNKSQSNLNVHVSCLPESHGINWWSIWCICQTTH